MENNWSGKNSLFKDMDKDVISTNVSPIDRRRLRKPGM